MSIKAIIRTSLLVLSLVFASVTFLPKEASACDHYYVLVVDAAGDRWIYEYDCDGRIIEIMPELI